MRSRVRAPVITGSLPAAPEPRAQAAGEILRLAGGRRRGAIARGGAVALVANLDDPAAEAAEGRLRLGRRRGGAGLGADGLPPHGGVTGPEGEAADGDVDGQEQGGEGEEERLLPLPATPYPALITDERPVNPHALVEWRGNRYSVPPGLVGHQLTVRQRLGDDRLTIVTAAAGIQITSHRRLPDGAGQTARHPEHREALEAAVLSRFSTARPCRRKENRPPGPAARAAAARLLGSSVTEVYVDLARYAELAEAGSWLWTVIFSGSGTNR